MLYDRSDPSTFGALFCPTVPSKSRSITVIASSLRIFMAEIQYILDIMGSLTPGSSFYYILCLSSLLSFLGN